MEALSCSVKSRKKEVEEKIKETKKKPPETGRGWRDGRGLFSWFFSLSLLLHVLIVHYSL